MKTRAPKVARSTVKYDPFANDLKLPTLYKKTSTGAIQYWRVSVIEDPDHSVGYQVWTYYGQVDGKEQETVDHIYEGKNLGKKNETTPKQQAEAEAKAKWEKQKKKGYVETIEAAEEDETDDLIEGGILPMLAKKFMEVIYDSRPGHENDPPQMIKTKDSKKIKFPAAGQPKLDGIRCIAIVKDGVCTLWSRTRKPIRSVPHIVTEIEALFGHRDIILDGELYNHALKKDFEKIVSMVRQDEPAEGCEIVQYHIYDQICDGTFSERFSEILKILEYNEPYSLFAVETKELKDEDAVWSAFKGYIAKGYEGLMLRNKSSKYVNKRSSDLQKMKEFQDDDFSIVGIEEGSGKLKGHVGSFICVDRKGAEFSAKMEGDTERLREYFVDHSLWTGKTLTVRYQGFTGANKVPRFPVGIVIRDYE